MSCGVEAGILGKRLEHWDRGRSIGWRSEHWDGGRNIEMEVGALD